MRGSQKRIDSPPPCSSNYLLSVSDKCLSSFWFTVQLCWVHTGWSPQRHVDTPPSPPPWLFYSCIVVRGGELREHSVEKFHFTLCVSIDFYWSLDKNQSGYCQKAKFPPHSLSRKGQEHREEICSSGPECVDMLDDCAGLCCVCVRACVCVLPLCYSTFTLRGLSLGLLWRSKAQWFAQRARPRHADGLDMHNVVGLFFQVP